MQFQLFEKLTTATRRFYSVRLTDWRREFRSHAVERESLNLRHYADWINISLRGNYSVTNSIGATQRFSANHKTSSEQKNRSSFISDQLQMRVNSDWETGNWCERQCESGFDTSICCKMLFIFITEMANKYFLNGNPKSLRNRLKNRYI